MELAFAPGLVLAVVAVPALLAGFRRPGASIALPAVAGLRGVRPSLRQRLRRSLPVLRAAAIVLLAIAVARPRVAEADAIARAEGIDIALAFDLSSSMESNRVGDETRLDAAKQVIRDFIGGREDDRIGIVVFQRDALVLAPLSLDYVALDRTVADVESGLLPDGTGVGVGIAAALNLLRDSPATSRVVILLTDGEHNADSIRPEDAADLAAALRIRVYAIGIVETDERGVTRADFDEDRLRDIAERTGGVYFDAASRDDLAAVYDEIGRLEKSRVGREGFLEYTEYGPWIALAAGIVLAVEVLGRALVFRRIPA